MGDPSSSSSSSSSSRSLFLLLQQSINEVEEQSVDFDDSTSLILRRSIKENRDNRNDYTLNYNFDDYETVEEEEGDQNYFGESTSLIFQTPPMEYIEIPRNFDHVDAGNDEYDWDDLSIERY